jgi:hypothetical protein
MSVLRVDNPPVFYNPPASLETLPLAPSSLNKNLSNFLKTALITSSILASGCAIEMVVNSPASVTAFIAQYVPLGVNLLVWGHQLLTARGVWGELGQLVGPVREEDINHPRIMAGKIAFNAFTFVSCALLWVEASLLYTGKPLLLPPPLLLLFIPIAAIMSTRYYLREISTLNKSELSQSIDLI